MTDTLGLKALLVRRNMTIERLSKLTGISRASLSYKINNKRDFTTREILKMQDVLLISDEERNAIFLHRS